MKRYNLLLSLYYLPGFFLVLAISPNIVGWRIALSLVGVLCITVPAVNYLSGAVANGIYDDKKTPFQYRDLISVMLLAAAVFLGQMINWQMVVLILIYLGINVLSNNPGLNYSMKAWLSLALMRSFLVISLIYIGFNQYGFSHLIKGQNAIVLLLSTMMSLCIIYLDRVTLHLLSGQKDEQVKLWRSFGLLIITVSLIPLWLFFNFIWSYTAIFLLASLPGTLLYWYLISKEGSLSSNKDGKLLKVVIMLLVIGWVISFTYLFLASTHVLQAVLGGY